MTTALQLTPQQALENLKKSNPSEFSALEKYLKKDIAALGDGEFFTMKDKKGDIKAFKSNVRLSIANAGLYKVFDNQPGIITAIGYKRFANASGWNTVFPEKVHLNGMLIKNPDVVSQKGKKFAIARCICYGLTPQGVFRHADRTSLIEYDTANITRLLQKAKKSPSLFRLAPKGAKIEEKGVWVEMPIDGNMSLFMNCSHESSFSMIEETQKMFEFILQRAQTNAERNAIKAMCGYEKTPASGSKSNGDLIYPDHIDLPAICWRAEGGMINYNEAKFIELQKQTESIAGNSETVIEQGDGGEVIDIDVDPEKTIEIQPEPKKEFEQKAKAYEDIDPVEAKKIEANYNFAAKNFVKEFQTARNELRYGTGEDSIYQKSEIMKKMNQLMSEEKF